MLERHELRIFLDQVTAEIADEYARIYKRTKEDPGTAGDEGESNWAKLLEDWLPADLHVATKGRIISSNGEAGPQVDVVILSGDYPRKLRDKKIYLAGGVVAAFECKNTLRKRHLGKFFKNAAAISKLEDTYFSPTLYTEAFSPILYGLLAHSHEWKDAVTATAVIDGEIEDLVGEAVHPRELPAVIAVSDLLTWEGGLNFGMIGPDEDGEHRLGPSALEQDLLRFASTFDRGIEFVDARIENVVRATIGGKTIPNPVGALITHLMRHLTLGDPRKKSLGAYFWRATGSPLSQRAAHRVWGVKEVCSSGMIEKMMTNSWWEEIDREPKNRHRLP
ncbi:hypothetical protein Q0Z83_027440 [Actinoplanes sichuanensis]|uniref:DUF6602 domain-containing protein n=1 Tax=Actinoplanes sichuanensis TaxID=512349 RepID=A0ABW4ATD6_9ACTN|nr:DUF6602 domain-containing protein [Actinoplanes sichuanensis]BEL04553.1 hypothetical protein Q0Z83_027440 [Actinoplanes sichuanensis]